MSGYMIAFTLYKTDEEAISEFRKRFGREPEELIRNSIVLVGPIPERESGDERESIADVAGYGEPETDDQQQNP